MKATHIPFTLILSMAFLSGVLAQTPQTATQQAQTPAGTSSTTIQNGASAPSGLTIQPACAAETDPDAKIACLKKERERLLKLEEIKKMEQDNAAIGKAPATPEVSQDKPKKKRTDCLMPGDKQKFLPEILHGFYDAQRAKIIKDSKGQITPPTWAEIHVPLPPCPVEPAIPATAR